MKMALRKCGVVVCEMDVLVVRNVALAVASYEAEAHRQHEYLFLAGSEKLPNSNK
jgi:hypothetical protein